MMGSTGPWLIFPVSEPVLLFQQESFQIVGILFNFLLAVMVLGWLLDQKVVFAVATTGCLGILASFFCSIVMEGADWIQLYIKESEQRQVLGNFLAENYLPNLNPQPRLIMIDEFGNLSERLLLSWHMIGWGWTLALIGICFLIVLTQFNSRVRLPAQMAVLVVAITSIVYLLPAIDAEIAQRRGDMSLASGKPDKAMVYYEEALQKDFLRQYSSPFLHKVSHAYSALHGSDSTLSALYFSDLYNSEKLNEVTAARQVLLSATIASTIVALNNPAPGEKMQAAIIAQLQAQDEKLKILLGMAMIANDKFASAAVVLRQLFDDNNSPIHIRFLLAHAYIKLGMYNDAIGILETSLPLVANSSIRADIQCTIADAYRASGLSLSARDYYNRCLTSDSMWNYRAVMGLTGV